jgi:23S rRNA (adenine2503-C2)-methyltransferase
MKALLGLKEAELQELALKLGIESYRGSQLASWIYQKGETNFALMTDLPQAERERLARETSINPLQIQDIRTTRDKTTKYLFELGDGEMIEAVRIPHRKWETICVSTQVGCPIGCVFCASGRDFVRNLTAGEIVGQVLLARKEGNPNIVFMGIGEPLLNREELFRALEVLKYNGLNRGDCNRGKGTN